MASIRLQAQMENQVARVTLARPERLNAFDREMLRELGGALRRVADARSVRLLVIEGEGKAFSAGADLQAAAKSDSVSNYLGGLARAFHSVLESLAACPALVVTNVNGAAAGGGFALALAGDLRLAAPEARLRVGYGRVGLTVDGGLSWRLPRLVGTSQAQRLLYEDPDLDADEAHALGLVHRVVPASDLQKTIEEILGRVKLQGRNSVVRARELLLAGQGRTLAESMEAEAVLLKASASTIDGREGIQAFLEKRAPRFGP